MFTIERNDTRKLSLCSNSGFGVYIFTDMIQSNVMILSNISLLVLDLVSSGLSSVWVYNDIDVLCLMWMVSMVSIIWS